MASRSFLIRSPKEESNAAVRDFPCLRRESGNGDLDAVMLRHSRVDGRCEAPGISHRCDFRPSLYWCIDMFVCIGPMELRTIPGYALSVSDANCLSVPVAEAVLLGAKNAAIAGTVVAVPTLVGCRVLPWAKANLNYTAQALIISAACIAGFFITADKTILRNARQNTIGKLDKST
ncbi:hypothetical protein EJB05_24943 [Eragrostis curvula]|uniref:Uncharacterized protein n=1 Tax=Eragrostis curvula TaxID=38414 RepID=A0A5J9VCN1_9POAL|nr:hypothetical protein EJB05_24943 [Eragrostis curvula]